ncbi:hypothetical protein RhiirA4_486930 [Rhizophagus irregularis]|uniref:Uncharacterized protein n=1 Tax=Rhizophagus irregularis TaxID=588596 RepID=A0A2I1HRY8_9GLOM|nr:hypothetical protein RhiirA4_486930 [Rhizophagus irregularis]
MNRSRAFDTYFKVLTSAIERCRDEIVKERLRKMRNAEIQKDWELWLEERKAVSHKFNFDIHHILSNEISKSLLRGTLATTQMTTIPDIDDEGEEVENHEDIDEDDKGKDDVDKDEDDEDDVNKDEDDKDDEDSKFVERHEPDTMGRTKRWILSSGTDVGQVLASYRCLIPESQKCMNPVYWGILDLTGTHPETKQLFSTEDWTEMLKSFEDEIETIEEDIPDVVCLFFDEIEQIIKNNEKSEDIVTEIDRISSRK